MYVIPCRSGSYPRKFHVRLNASTPAFDLFSLPRQTVAGQFSHAVDKQDAPATIDRRLSRNSAAFAGGRCARRDVPVPRRSRCDGVAATSPERRKTSQMPRPRLLSRRRSATTGFRRRRPTRAYQTSPAAQRLFQRQQQQQQQ